VVLAGGSQSAPLAEALIEAGFDVLAVANTGDDSGGRRPDVEALGEVDGVTVVPVTDDPNPTTVVVAGRGELPAAAWVRDGRPGRLLAVRMAGNPRPYPTLVDAFTPAVATILGPDDADLVIDPILKVLAQSGVQLPAPVIAAGHHHHRFEGFAHHHVDGDASSVLDRLCSRSESDG
jgi:hypothetical protein